MAVGHFGHGVLIVLINYKLQVQCIKAAEMGCTALLLLAVSACTAVPLLWKVAPQSPRPSSATGRILTRYGILLHEHVHPTSASLHCQC